MSDPKERMLHAAGLLVLLAVVAPFVVYAVPQAVGASQSYVVLSDSMSPEIRAGDVVVVDERPTATIEVGDVITYERTGGGDLVTHRVVEVVERDGETLFRTQGDANEELDLRPIPARNVVGVVLFHVPLIGHLISFGSTDAGIVLFVVVPSILLVASELYSLYNDVVVNAEPEGGSDP